MWLPLWAFTLYRAILSANADDRIRPSLFLWVAAPAVAAVAWGALNFGQAVMAAQSQGLVQGTLGIAEALQYDAFGRVLFFMSVGLLLALGE